MPRDADGLTPKQRRFVNEYLIDLNASRAAIRAGCGKGGEVTACKWLKLPKIQAAVAKGRAEHAEKTGRPPITIDPKVVEAMAQAGAPNTEIADFLGCSVDTLTRRFADILTKSRAGRKVRLRRLQWTAAEAGNPALLIWLGKQELAQREPKQELEHSGALTIDQLLARRDERLSEKLK